MLKKRKTETTAEERLIELCKKYKNYSEYEAENGGNYRAWQWFNSRAGQAHRANLKGGK